ncbi:GMC oxidoreductase-domain-containing protein, partial [Thelonectria olida]
IRAWALHELLEDRTVMWADAALLARREPANIGGDNGTVPDVLMHIYTMPFDAHQKALGYDIPKHVFSLTPNIPRSRSRGKTWLKSADPKEHPAIDFRCFSDPDGYDEATIVWSFKAARNIVSQQPLKKWIKREVAPGPAVQTDQELPEYGRKTGNTVYHPCGTAKMENIHHDRMAVVDPELKVKGIKKLRIADASVFPLIPTVNLTLTVLAVGERAAEFIIAESHKPVANL